MVFDNTFKCTTKGKYFKIIGTLFCNCINAVCLTTCQCGKLQYVGFAIIFKDFTYIKVI